MKKLILIIASFLLLGACTTHIDECDIVTSVKFAPKSRIDNNADKKYEIERGGYFGECIYTDSLYQVGDTLCLTLKQ